MARRETQRPGKRARWTADKARQTMAAWERSGLSMAAFCRQRGIQPQRFYWWRNRLAAWSEQSLVRVLPAADEHLQLVEVVVTDGGSAPVEIHLRSGDRIEVTSPAHVDAGWLLQIARGLSVAETSGR